MTRIRIHPSSRTLSQVAMALAIVSSAFAPAAQGALVTLSGWNFDVTYEDTQAGAAVFGTPALSWNTIVFTPTGFLASSLDGAGPDTVASSFTFDLTAKPNLAFSQLLMSNRGDYRIEGPGSSVSVAGGILASAPGGGSESASLLVSPSKPLDLADGALHPWLGTALVAIGAGSALGSEPTALTVTLSSTLFADTSTAPSIAFIQQKFSGGRVELQLRPSSEPTPVPLPAGAWLFAAGLTAMGTLMRRTRRA